MKKFLQYFLIVPIIFIAIFTLFACGDDDIKSINLSIPNYELIEGSYIINKADLQENGSGEKRISLQVDISPSNYTAGNLTFEVNNLGKKNVVKEVRVRENNTFIIFGKDIGQANIIASYKRSDNRKVTATIKLLVDDKTSTIKFSEYTYKTTYTGEPLESNYRVIDDEEGKFNYNYYLIDTDKNNQQTEVKEIVNVGRYHITCTDPEDETSTAETFLIVNKYKFSFKANNYETYYGDGLPEGLYYEGDAPANIIGATTISTKILYGVGKDKTASVGKYAELTPAKRGSNYGVYETYVKMDLFSEYKQNYEVSYDVEKASLRVLAKEVVLKGSSQDAVYGDRVRHTFELYAYSEYIENEKDLSKCTPLGNKEINFVKDVNLGDAVYKVNSEVAERNGAGQLDVLIVQKEGSALKEYGSYEVCFDNATTGRNLILKEVLNGSLKLTPRTVSILPTIGQSKIYGTQDPKTFTYNIVGGSVINHDNIINPLSIRYMPTDDTGFGEGNYLASAGKYYYEVNNSLNLNYDILLDGRALEENSEIAEEDKVTYEIKPCPIEIKLRDKTERYKTPTGVILNGVQSHTVGYFGTAEDYRIEIEYIKIGGTSINLDSILLDKPEGDDNAQLGRVDLATGGKFYFNIKAESVENSNYYLTYKVSMSGWWPTDGAVGTNYLPTGIESTLNLTKSQIKIIPNAGVNFRKVYDAISYDATNVDNSLFTNAYGTYYYAVDENGETIDLNNIVEDVDDLLTLVNKNEYFKLNTDGIYEPISIFKDVGKYKIYLSEDITYKKDMEYYQLVLDTSKTYNYEIEKATVSISVTLGQTKVYGSADPLPLRFEWSNLPNNDDVEYTGSLSRANGEDVGEYAIGLGSLSFGENYTLQLNSNLAVFTITPRTITVKPYSYSYVYGEQDISPLYNYVIEDGYDRNILVAPVFEGSFNISYPDDIESIVARDGAGFYPVYVVDNLVSSYSITQGSFGTKTNNYTILFDNSESTFTITKRNIQINIKAQERENLGNVETETFTLGKEHYTVTGLVGNVVTSLDIKLNASNNYYCYVENNDETETQNFAINLTLNGNNVNNNYNPILEANIVYQINMAVVYLSIVNKQLVEAETSVETSSFEAVYKGEPFEDIFKLISKTSDYEIDYENSKFKFKFRNSNYSGDKPQDAGNYVANIDLDGEGAQLVIINKNAQTEENRKIVFTKDTYTTMVGNAVINIASLGYLNILKAPITVNYSPEFENDFVYEDICLPMLKTVGSEGNIFADVHGNAITLKTYNVTCSDGTTKTLNFMGSGYSISNFQANYTYNIMVSIQKTTRVNGREEIDSNYETLILPAVPLHVAPRQIGISGGNFTIRNTQETNLTQITYDGSLKSLSLTLLLQYGAPANYTTTYSYQKLAVTYGDGTAVSDVAMVTCRYYYGGDSFSQESFQMAFKDIQVSSTLEIVEYAGGRYVINGNTAILMEGGGGSSVSPDNAGVYICIATCNTYDNYTFALNYGGISSSVQYSTLFQIKKSGAVTFDETKWKEKFYYSTRFDFRNQSSLPFVYEIYPSYLKQYIVFSMDNYDNLSTSGYLKVGTYTVTLTINTDNYFVQFNPKFEIEKLVVDFVFPLLKSYVYIGKDLPVTNFLSNIRVVRRDNEGVAIESFYYDPYSSQSKDIVLTYYKRDENGIIKESESSKAPYEIGNYTLRMSYGTDDVNSADNYKGSGEFEYSIVQRAFTGSIRVENATITYDPLYTQEYFYEEIKNRMFTIDRDGGFTVTLYRGREADPQRIIIDPTSKDAPIIDYSNITDPSQLGWLREVNSEGQHYITFVIVFDDDKIEPVQRDAILTVKKKTFDLDDFDFDTPTNSTRKTYIYDGFPEYNCIYYTDKNNKILLDPALADYSKNVGKYRYHFRSIKTERDEYVSVLDNMFNTIFILRYAYENGIGEQLATAPINPGTGYKVYYDIVSGENYTTNGLDRPFGIFDIENIDTLYINIKDLSNLGLQYSGLNLLTGEKNERAIGNNKLTDLIVVRKDESAGVSQKEKEVNYTLYFNDLYLEEYGIYLEIFFTDDKGEIVDKIIKAGTYTMHLGVAYTPNYNIIDYFDTIRVGTRDVVEMASNKMRRAVVNDISRNWYNPITEVSFVVGNSDSPYNAGNYTDVFSFTGVTKNALGSNQIVELEPLVDEIFIRIKDARQADTTLTILIKEGNAYNPYKECSEIKLDEVGALAVKDSNNNYNVYRVIIKSANYKDSEYIEFRFKTP